MSFEIVSLEKYCPRAPTPVENSSFKCTDIDPVTPQYPYNTLCQLVCDVGFAADQDTYVRCDDNKLWDGIEAAECKGGWVSINFLTICKIC